MLRKIMVCSFFIIMVIGYGQSNLGSYRTEDRGRLVPKLMNYQGYLTDTLDVPIDDTLDMTFTIYNMVSGGQVLWTEDTSNVPIEKGIFHTMPGSINPIPDSVFADFTNTWLEITLEGPQTLTPRTRITSALYAYDADMLDGMTSTDFVAEAGDTMSGTLTVLSDIITPEISNLNPAPLEFRTGDVTRLSILLSGDVQVSNARLKFNPGSLNLPTGVTTTEGDIWYNSGNVQYRDASTTRTLLTTDYGGDNDWSVTDSVLYTGSFWGLARGGADNAVYSTGNAHTHVNFGRICTTGLSGADFHSITIGGGSHHSADSNWSTISGGLANKATGGYSSIGGGAYNEVYGRLGAIFAGYENTAYGTYGGTFIGYYNDAGNSAADTGVVIVGGVHNDAMSKFAVIGGGRYNYIDGDYSAILGGYADTITSTADFSYLFGIASTCTQDSTFMVDMPHIWFGDEINGYEFPADDGSVDQVLTTDGLGQLNWTNLEDSDWTISGNNMYSNVSGNVGIGTYAPTADLTVTDTTGETSIRIARSDDTYASVFGFTTGGVYDWSFTTGAGSDNLFLTRGSGSGGLYLCYNGGNVAIGTGTASTHKLNVVGYSSGNAAVRGADQSGATIYAEGQLGILSPSGLPYNPTNIGVLGMKPNAGGNGVAVYGWNNDDNASNYAMYTICDGTGTTNYALYAKATNGGTNWAGYFDGDVNINGDLTISGAVPEDNDWTRGTPDSVLFTSSLVGISRGSANNMFYGDSVYSHINLGIVCSTGMSGPSSRHITISGGYGNKAMISYGTVGGGYSNAAHGSYATIAGGYENNANLASFVGGGQYNSAGPNIITAATIGGGISDTVMGRYGSILGGYSNLAGDADIDTAAVVVGGWNNAATAGYGFVGGGRSNANSSQYGVLVGGTTNQVTATWCGVVGGGNMNMTSGDYGTVPGGRYNQANGDYSLAAGYHAVASYAGCFVWGDNSTTADFISTGTNQFLIRADGGVGINTNAPLHPLHISADYSDLTGSDGCFIDIQNTNTSADVLSGIRFCNGTTANTFKAAIFYEDSASYGRGALIFANNSLGAGGNVTVSDARMVITYTGDIGIGTLSPSADLDVVSGIRTSYPEGHAVTDQGRITDSTGYFVTYGANGTINSYMVYTNTLPNNGWISVHDDAGSWQARMYVDGAGNGIITGDTKSFTMDNPSQPGTEIWYCCIEGPEAAAYVRGTGHLVNGRAVVKLPQHFTDVAIPEGMTVQVTPNSADSKGLAVVKKDIDGIIVREISNGTGTYDFDYMVIAVRKGYKDWQVIRPKSESQPAPLTKLTKESENQNDLIHEF